MTLFAVCLIEYALRGSRPACLRRSLKRRPYHAGSSGWPSHCVVGAVAHLASEEAHDWSSVYEPTEEERERRKAAETERRLAELRANGQIVRLTRLAGGGWLLALVGVGSSY
jgi:hypothetical protein